MGPTPQKGSKINVVRCYFMYTRAFADLCYSWRPAWPNLLKFSIRGPPQVPCNIKAEHCTCMYNTTLSGELIFQGSSVYSAPIHPVGSAVKTVLSIPFLLRAVPVSLFFCPSLLMCDMCWYFPLILWGNGWGWWVRGNKCHNNIPFQKNIV